MAKIGFIGLGIMGAHMARNLLKGGHTLVVNGKYPVPDDLREKTTVVEDSTAVARTSEIVISMVPDTPDVENVLFADDGVAAGLSAGKLVIDMSSISPLDTQAFAKRVNALGCDYLDAPVSGGEVGAKAASLTIMIGGPTAEFERALPIFEKLGKNITRVGGNGDGQTCKVANQIIVALNIEAVAEALVFASKAGCDPAKVRAALMGGFAQSRVLEVHGERMITGNWKPGFKAKLFKKDFGIAMSTLNEYGVPANASAVVNQTVNAQIAAGDGEEDYSGIAKVIFRLANLQ